MLKNAIFKSASHALGFPAGDTTTRPDAPIPGQTRYNTASGKLEFYNNSIWNAVAREGNVLISNVAFTGTGTSTEFGPLNNVYSPGQEPQVLVHVGAVYQIPNTNYTFYGNTKIHFSVAPSLGAQITIVEGLASTVSTLA